MPAWSATRRSARMVSRPITAPPARLWVFSTAIARVGTAKNPSGRIIAATASTSMSPPAAGQVRLEIPP